MIHKMQDEQTIQAQHQVPSKWWTTATPLELRMSANVVLEFLSKTHHKHGSSVESFSRALALRQLLEENDAVVNAMQHAYELIPDTRNIDSPEKVTPTIKDEIAHCELIKEGLSLCLDHLKPHDRLEWFAAFERYAIALAISKQQVEHPVSRKLPGVTRKHL